MCSLKMQSDPVTGEWQKAICYLQLCDDGHTFLAVMVLVSIMLPYLPQRSKICEMSVDCFMVSMGHTHFRQVRSVFCCIQGNDLGIP